MTEKQCHNCGYYQFNFVGVDKWCSKDNEYFMVDENCPLAEQYEKLHNKLYERDFFEVEISSDYMADSRRFQNGLCVFNNRLGMAYSVTEIVKVLNSLTFENQKLKERINELEKENQQSSDV